MPAAPAFTLLTPFACCLGCNRVAVGDNTSLRAKGDATPRSWAADDYGAAATPTAVTATV